MATSAVLVVLGIVGVVSTLAVVAWRFGAEEPPRVPLPGNVLPARQKPAAPVARLVMAAPYGKNTYLQVYQGSRVGRPIYQGTLEGGQARTVRGARLWLFVSAPANLRLKLNGRAIEVPGQGTGGRRWLLVTRSGVTVAPKPA